MAKKIVGAIVTLILFGGLSTVIYALTTNQIVVGYNINYEPTQPIPYSHELHAGTLKIDCKYCHVGTKNNRHALVPSLNICMNCHKNISAGESEALQTLTTNFYSGVPFEWQKVHLLPDHVKFAHAPHVLAGKDCTTCHGEVEKMKTVKQVKSLSMGWCVNCHREQDPPAPTTCSTCHY